MSVFTLSQSESLRVGKSIFRYVSHNNRGEIVVKVLTDEPVAMVKRDGTERSVRSGAINKLHNASIIRRITIDRRA